MKLTREIEETILAYVLAGSFDYVAAEAAGVSDRSFREWIARGEGRHPTRGPTPQLRVFAKKVRTARAQARAAREIKLAEIDPKHWLKYLARSQPGRDGWTEPVPEERDPGGAESLPSSVATPEEAAEVWGILLAAGALEPPAGTTEEGGEDGPRP